MRIIFCILLSFVLFAENSPEDVKIKTPKYDYQVDNFQPKIGKYTYDVSWSSIPAAKIDVTVSNLGDGYKITTDVNTNSSIDIFYKLRFVASSELTEDFLPIKTNVYSQENSRIKKSEIEFTRSGYIHSIRDFVGRKREEFNFNPENFTLDPFSAAFIARTFDWKAGEEREFDTFNGKTRYLIKFKSIGNKDVEYNGKIINAMMIQPDVIKLNPMNDGKKKLNSATIYISNDKNRDILKIESDVFIGTVTTQLKSFIPNQKIYLAKNTNN